MVLQLLGELLEVGLAQWDHLPAAGLLQHGPVPVIGTHSPQQDPVLGGDSSRRHRARAKAPKILCQSSAGGLGDGFGASFRAIFLLLEAILALTTRRGEADVCRSWNG